MNLLYFPIDQGPLWFCIALGAVLLLTLLLEHLETRFVKNKAQREQPFTMLDLEFPADRQDLERVLWDIARLGAARALRVRRAIRTHLFLDYLFMPFAYGAIFFLSMLVAGKFPAGSAGQTGFALLAWAQLIAWACDIAENAVLWRQVRQDPQPMSKLVFNSFVTLVWGKWGIALAGVALGLSMAAYFWLKGAYAPATLPYFGIVGIEFLAFFIVRALGKRRRKGGRS
ncbi:MAG: hypothetical protein IPI11_15860 [Haliscomenobacter sp.]|nr:hypothetical protein [Haliscomenobacter sp.]